MISKLKYLLSLIVFLTLSNSFNAQLASPTCSAAAALTNGTYSNVVTQSNVGWFSYLASSINLNINLINYSNNPQNKIEKIEFYQGVCGNLALMAADSLSNFNDSTLNLAIGSLTLNSTYSIKVSRRSTENTPSVFALNLAAPIECGFYWGTQPLTLTTTTLIASITGNWSYNGFSGSCLKNIQTGDTSTSAPNSYICNFSLTTCENLYLGYANNGSFDGNSGTFCIPNTIFYIFPNVPGTTFSVSSGSQGTVAINLGNIPGATQYTIVSNYTCTPLPVTPTLTVNDLAGCSCDPIIVNVTNLSCNLTIPQPLCANQPFCFTTPLPPLPPPPTNGLNYLYFPVSNNICQVTNSLGVTSFGNCFPNGISAGTYTVKVTKGLQLFGTVNGTGQQVDSVVCSCSLIQTVTVLPNNIITPNILASPVNGCAGQGTTLTANNGNPNATYTWQPGNIIGNPVTVNLPNGVQSYTVSTTNGCASAFNIFEISGLECCRFSPRVGAFYFNNVTLVPFNSPNSTPWANLVQNATYSGINIAAPSGNVISSVIAVSGYLNITASNLTFFNANLLFSDAASFVQNANNLTIDRCYFRGCKNWQGIFSLAVLNITNSVIEDAQYAVRNGSSFNPNTPHPGISIENVLFNNNFCAVLISNRPMSNFVFRGNLVTCRVLPPGFNLNNTTPWQYQPNYDLATLQTYPTVFLKGSASLGLPTSLRGQFGVQFINTGRPSATQNLQIGDFSNNTTNQTNYRNVFDNLRIGVTATSSRMGVYNSVFNLMRGLGSPLDLNGPSAGVFLSTTRGNVGFNTTGNNNAAIYTNTFITSQNGVVATAQSTFNVANNNFNSISAYANHVYSINSGANIPTSRITNNSFTQCLYDLYAINNQRIDVRFENNTSNNTSFSRPRFNYYVYLNELNKPTTADYYVRNNTLNGKLFGVYGINIEGAQISNNIINIIPPPANTFNANVWLQGSDACEIKFNTTNVFPSNSGVASTFGMFAENSVNNLFCENDIKGAGAAMKFQGTSPSRIYRNKLNVNPADPCFLGIFLDNSGFVGPINFPQGGNIYTADNEFGDFLYFIGGADTYAQFGSSGSQIDYQGAAINTNNYYPFVNLFQITPPSTPFSPFSNNSTGFSSCNAAPMNIFQRLSRGVPPFVNSVVNFGANTGNANGIARKSVYEVFKKDNYSNANIAGYTNFMVNNSNGNYGHFYRIDSLVYRLAATGNTNTIAQAQAINAQVNPSNVVEQNQKTFNAIYQVFLTSPALVAPAQITSLQNLAQLCPFTDGNAVYQSRALLKHYNDSIEYSNPCEFNLPNIQASGSRFSVNSNTALNESKEALTTKLYPNPAQTEVTITTELSNATLYIYNVIGQTVIEMPLSSQTKLNVSELKSGTYIYKIMSEGKLIKTDKLIINK